MEENNNQQPQNTATNNFNVSSSPAPKKKGKGGLVFAIIAIILILAIAVGLAYYFIYYTKPEQIYKRLVSSNIDQVTAKLTDTDYKTAKTNITLGAKVDTDNDDIDEDVLKLINKTSIEVETQADFENRKIIVNLDSNYDKKSLLNAQVYSDIEDEKTYVYLKDLLNKYIELDMNDLELSSDEDFYSLMDEMLENRNDTKNTEKATKIIKKELLGVIKPEYCSSSKEKIDVNGKEITATKNTIKMTEEQFLEELTTVLNNLKDNKDFINCFEDKEEVVENIENMLDSIDEEEPDDDSTIEINTYTQGLMNEVVKVTCIVTDDYQTVTMDVTKIETDKYAFEVKSEDDEDKTLAGIITIEKKNENEGKIVLEFNVEDFGTVALNIEYSTVYNEEIDEVEVKNSVELDNLTFADQRTMYTNFQKSPLYELVSGFVGGSSSKNKSLVDIDTIEKDDDDDEEEDDDEEKTESTEVSQNQIITYDNKIKVTFGVPEGYEVNTVSESFKRLEKGETSIKISSTIATEENYYDTIKEKADKYKEEEKYENVNLTEVETVEVGNIKFYVTTLSYTYVSGTYEREYSIKYIWTKANDKYVVELQATNLGETSEDELKEILTMKIEDKK